MAWGKYFYITFIVLSSQFCIFIFVLKCRIQLIRPICLVFLFKIVLSIHGFCSGRTIFPCSHRVQDPIPTPTWCSHRSNYQIMSILFFYCLLFQFVYYWEILYSFLRMCFLLLFFILGSLYMPKIILTILKKIFWIIKGKTMLVCLPVKPSYVLVLSLALTNLFVHSSTFILISRKELPNLSSCKVLLLFHNCYYRYC